MTPSGDSERHKRPGKGEAKPGHPQAAPSRQPKQAAQRTSGEERGILANLPSTRPQRPSARRAAAKRAADKRAADKPAADKRAADKPAADKRAATKRVAAKRTAAKRTTAKPTSSAATKRRADTASPPPVPPIPPQGFATEDEIEPGTPVQPPSPPEVAGALAELLGELAQTGIVRGGRVLRDVLGRLPGI